MWWEPESDSTDRRVKRRNSKLSDDDSQRSWKVLLKKYACYFVPRKLRSFKGCCTTCCIKVVHPDSRFRSSWNVCLAFFILYCGFSVPFEIAFETDMIQSMCTDPQNPYGKLILRGECDAFLQWFWLNFIVDVFFMADICLNFRTGYMSEGHFVSDDWLVAKSYLKGSFIMDCLGTFPLNILLMITNPANPYGDTQVAEMIAAAETAAGGSGTDVGRANRMLRLLRMAKLAKLARMRKLAKYAAAFEEYLNPGVLAIVKLVAISIICCHMFGSLWWMISDLEMSEEASGSEDLTFASPYYAGENKWHPPFWLKHEASLSMKYMHAFFWGAGMVTSLVPRDIEPLTIMESLVTTSTMFFGLLLNAFVISSLNQALASMNASKQFTGKQLEMIKSYLLVKQVPSSLRGRVMEFYEYLLSSSAALEDLNMFNSLPPALTAQLNISTHRRLLANCAFFKGVSNGSLIALIAELKALVLIPSQTVINQGNRLEMAYFVNRGIVQSTTHDGSMGSLTNCENFGLEDYFAACVAKSKPQASKTYKAVTYCDLMSLAVEAMNLRLKKDPMFQATLAEAQRAARASERAKRESAGGTKPRSGGRAMMRAALRGTPSKSGWGKGALSSKSLANAARAAKGLPPLPPPPPKTEKEAQRGAITNLAKLAEQAEREEEEERTKSVSFASGSEVPKPPRPKLRAAILRVAKKMAEEQARGGDGYGNFPAGASSSATTPTKTDANDHKFSA